MAGYILSGILLLILAGIAIRHLCNNRRLKQLSENMEDYLVGIGGNLPLSLKEDTIAQVENAAMEMQNRIDVAEERFRQEAKRTSNLTADISHQLKTPLASLRLYCEMDSSPHCEQQIVQIERMETLISSLLRLERLCADGYQFEYAECDLRKMIERDWQQMHPLWPGRTLTIEGEATIRCDEKWLAEAFRNLIKNACEHTAEDGHIRIYMETTDKFLYGTLEDDANWPQDLFVIGYVLTAMRPDYLDQDPVEYPVFADPAKKSKEEIEAIALKAFHEAADAEKGAEWVDGQKLISALWNSGIYEFYGIDRQEPTWRITLMELCDGTWESKGVVMIDEDGNVLLAQMELEGNG